MRTTLDLDDQLLRKAKTKAAANGQTLTAMIEDALRREVSLGAAAKKAGPVKLHTLKGRGLQPGIDLNDSASLLDLLDQPNEAGRR